MGFDVIEKINELQLFNGTNLNFQIQNHSIPDKFKNNGFILNFEIKTVQFRI